MKRLLLICLVLCFFAMGCTINEYLKCSDCYDRESVVKETHKLVGKILNDIDYYEVSVKESEGFFTISYELNKPLTFGGGCFLKISKEDCKIVEYKRTK